MTKVADEFIAGKSFDSLKGLRDELVKGEDDASDGCAESGSETAPDDESESSESSEDSSSSSSSSESS